MTTITFTKKRKEKMSNKYCLNCGQVHAEVLNNTDNYVSLPLKKIVQDYDGREYEIEICRIARYENTISQSQGA